jgi:hypothetical protein
LHLGAIDFLGPVPVKLVEGLNAGEARGGNAALDCYRFNWDHISCLMLSEK